MAKKPIEMPNIEDVAAAPVATGGAADEKTPPSKGGRQITTNLPPEDFKRFKNYCTNHDVKQYEVVRKAILQFLDQAENN